MHDHANSMLAMYGVVCSMYGIAGSRKKNQKPRKMSTCQTFALHVLGKPLKKLLKLYTNENPY